MKRRKRLALLCALAAVGGVVWAAWPRGPSLVWYTSPPIRVGSGALVRIRVLLPAGWQELSPPDHTLPGDVILTLRPKPRKRWLPSRLDRILYRPDEPDANINILEIGSESVFQYDGVDTHIELSPDGTTPARDWADRYVKEGFYIAYRRGNATEFNATYRQICESFRVVR